MNNPITSNNQPQVNNVSFDFGEFGGNLNLEVNGDFTNFSQFQNLAGTTIGGANVSVNSSNVQGGTQGTVELTGAIEQFSVGGQELWLDNVEFEQATTVTFSSPTPSKSSYTVGDTFTSSSGVDVTVEDFVLSDGTNSANQGFLSSTTPPKSGGSGQDFNTDNVTLDFDIGSAVSATEDDQSNNNNNPFTPFNPEEEEPISLIEEIITSENNSLSIQPDSVNFAGAAGQSSFYDGSLNELGIDPGILLTSGDGTPPLENTSPGFSEERLGNSDQDLDTVANNAFQGSGQVQDANTLEFSFTIEDPSVNSVGLDLIFGSDEFPEFSNTDFIDVAAVIANGQNVGLFNNDATQPLSVIDKNLNLGNFIDNESGQVPGNAPPSDFSGSTQELPIEYDGVSSVLTVFAPVQQGENTIKLGVADTGDQILDSGLFVSNLRTSSSSGESGVLVDVPGSEEADSLEGTDINEFFNAKGGNDNIDPGAGNDVIDAGPGDDIIIGGQGNNEIDGGPGNDTVEYEGNQADFQIEAVDENTIQVGSNTDLLTNVEVLSFNDGELSAEEILSDQEEEDEDEAEFGLNTLILNGSDQQLSVGFDANIRGSAGEETILVEDGATVEFNPQSGDRVDLSQSLADYTIERSGLTELTLTENSGDDSITLTVNQGEPFQLRFADGDTTVSFNNNNEIAVGNEALAVDEQADTGNINLGDNVSQVGDSNDNNDATLPPLPNQGGPEEVTAGTAESDNIDGDQDGQTLNGGAGIDRFIFDNLVDEEGNAQTQEVTLGDFTEGEQILFEGNFNAGDLNIENVENADGEVTLQIQNTDIILTGLSTEDDQSIFSSDNFQEVFGEQALEFA